MKTFQLSKNLEFNAEKPHAEPLHVEKSGRVLRFTLKPGQKVKEHNAPKSPVYLVVLKGQGLFAGNDGNEQQFGPDSLLIFEPGEKHSVQALNEELVFVAFLHGAPSWH